MNEERDPRDAPRHRLSHAVQRAIARRTIAQALGGVALLMTAVFTLTGRCSENPNALRRLQAPAKSASADWYRLSIKVGGFSVPFLLSVPREEPVEGQALPEGLIVNGLEEIPVGVRRTETGFVVPMPWLGSAVNATVNSADDVTGTWSLREASGEMTSYDLTGHSIPDALAERRYAVAPAMPETQPTAAPIPTRFGIRLGDHTGILRYRPSTTKAVDVTLYIPGRSFGALAGSLFGRLLQASSFDGRRAAVLQATFDPKGESVTGFVSENGQVFQFTGQKLEERTPIASDRPVDLQTLPAPGVSGPALVWFTSTLDGAAQRAARSLAESLRQLEIKPKLYVRCYEPEDGFDVRAAAWLERHGLDADIQRIGSPAAAPLPLSTLVFVNANGDITRALTGIHDPGTGGSFRKQQARWKALAAELVNPRKAGTSSKRSPP